jgi:hypothetical protein
MPFFISLHAAYFTLPTFLGFITLAILSKQYIALFSEISCEHLKTGGRSIAVFNVLLSAVPTW